MADTSTSLSTVPSKDPAQELASEIGHAVLATLRKAAAEGRLPENLGSLATALANVDGAALVPRPGQPAAPATAAPPKKKAPGTRTIRMLIRGARDFAEAPAGSELARYRVALLALVLCLAVLAAALAFGQMISNT